MSPTITAHVNREAVARRWNFQTERQIAKIMIAITKRAARARRTPLGHRRLNGIRL